MIAFEPNNFPPKWVGGQKADNRIDQQRRQDTPIGRRRTFNQSNISMDPVNCTQAPLKLMTKESKHDWPIEKCLDKLKQASSKSTSVPESFEHLQNSYNPPLMLSEVSHLHHQ